MPGFQRSMSMMSVIASALAVGISFSSEAGLNGGNVKFIVEASW